MKQRLRWAKIFARQKHQGGASMTFYWILTEIRKLKRGFLETVLPIVDREAVEQALSGFSRRKRIYHAWPTFMMFLCQVAGRESCRKEIADAIGRKVIPLYSDEKTSSYCNARNRLPEEPLRELAFKAGEALAQKARGRELFFGRRVKVVDGSSTQLPDTNANQAEYPQPKRQAEGCGLPVMYFSALMDLATGAILSAETAGGCGSEQELFRKFWPSFKPREIILADALYMSYANIAILAKRGVDCVFRWNDRRHHRMSTFVRLGKDDWLETWERPGYTGKWNNPSDLPETITVRVVRFTCDVKGQRSRKIEIITTLTDPRLYPREKLMELYARRWEMELRLDDIKTTMKMVQLTCKTPDRCRKELWIGLLAYNLIRTIMFHAARRAGVSIARISFAGTRDRIDAFSGSIYAFEDSVRLYELLLMHVSHDQVPDRPNRVEPRLVKRRWTRHSLLTVPRNSARQALLRA